MEALVKQDHDITVVDNFSSGLLQNLKAVRKEIDILCKDISRSNFTLKKKYDVVYHLAAQPWSKDVDLRHNSNSFYTNVVGTYNVLKECQNSFFVFASSASVYGSGKKFNENQPLNISSNYGYTKSAAERLVEVSNNPYIVFRPGTVIGIHGRCFPNRLVWCAIHKIPVEIFYNGNTWRDLIDVRDVVSAFLIADKLQYGIYNLSSNMEISGKDLVLLIDSIAEKRGYKLRYSFVPWFPKGYIPESTLITKLEGSGLWKPQYKLEETLETLFDHYKQGGLEPPSWDSL